MKSITVKDFDSLCKRDFDNGAVKEWIRNALKERESLLARREHKEPPSEAVALLNKIKADIKKYGGVTVDCLEEIKSFPEQPSPNGSALVMAGQVVTGCEHLSPDGAEYEEAKANARLIAAAPEMFDLLEHVDKNGWDAGLSICAKKIIKKIEAGD